MDSKAQVSFDYLVTITFAISLTLAVAIIIVVISGLAHDAQARILNAREETISSVLGS